MPKLFPAWNNPEMRIACNSLKYSLALWDTVLNSTVERDLVMISEEFQGRLDKEKSPHNLKTFYHRIYYMNNIVYCRML